MTITSVEGLEVAHVGREGRAERVVIDGPSGLVLGMAVAVFLDQPVEELEQMAGRSKVSECVLERVVRDRVVHEMAETRPVTVGSASPLQARRCAKG